MCLLGRSYCCVILGPRPAGPLPCNPTLSLNPRAPAAEHLPALGTSAPTTFFTHARPSRWPVAAPRAHAGIGGTRATATEGQPAPDRQSCLFFPMCPHSGPALWLHIRHQCYRDCTVPSNQTWCREGSCQPHCLPQPLPPKNGTALTTAADADILGPGGPLKSSPRLASAGGATEQLRCGLSLEQELPNPVQPVLPAHLWANIFPTRNWSAESRPGECWVNGRL